MMNKKIIAFVLCAAAVFIPMTGRAQTTADLLAQIRALQIQINQLVAQLRILQGGAPIPAVCGGIVFSRNLTVGSTGNDVRCLQAFLNQSADTLVAGSSYGSPGQETFYFGLLSRSAVIRFQSKYASAIFARSGYTDAAGFVGLATRAQLNNLLLAPTVPAGGGNVIGGIVINGRQGTMAVSTNPTPASGINVYEGGSRYAILGIRVAATGSDLSVQRAAINFNSAPYNYFSTIYLYDGNTLLASLPLNSNTVSRIGSDKYSVAMTGFSVPFVVREGATKVITVMVDTRNNISTGVLPGNSVGITVFADANGVRAVNQANLAQTGPEFDTSVSRVVNVNRARSESAELSISRNSNSPATGNLVPDTGGNLSGAMVLVFDIAAQGDNLTIDDISQVRFMTGPGFLVPQTAYLYDSGGVLIDSASPNQTNGIVNFNGLEILLNEGVVRAFTIRIDDTVATNGSDDGKRYRVTVATDDGSARYFNVRRSDGIFLSAGQMSGSAVSNDQFVYLSGSTFTLGNVVTTPIIRTDVSPSGISANFTVRVNAQGGDIYIPKTGAFDVFALRNNESEGVLAPSIVYRASDNALEFANSYRVSQNTTATFAITATYLLDGTAGTYHLKVGRIGWGLSDTAPATNSSTYMQDIVSGFVYLQ